MYVNEDPHKTVLVAQLMTDMILGGIESVVMNYYRCIDKNKFQFDFIAPKGSTFPNKDEIEKLGGRIFVVPKYSHPFAYIKAVRKIFRENHYKIVHCHMNTMGIFAMYAAYKEHIPIRILHNHSMINHFFSRSEFKRNILKYVLRAFCKIYPSNFCACSKAAGDWMYGKNFNYKIFNNGINVDKFKFNLEIRKSVRSALGLNDNLVVGHIGRFCPQKNHNFLVEIFNNLLSLHDNAVLLLIGEGELLDQVKLKVKQFNIEDKVIFLGKQNDTSKYYQAMDVFCLPSRYEGLPVVAVEAQCSGLPCLFSTYVSKESKILDSTEFLSYDDTLDKWSQTMFELANNQRVDGAEQVRNCNFDMQEEAKKLELYYQHLLLDNEGK